jgi:hypothetical protein
MLNIFDVYTELLLETVTPEIAKERLIYYIEDNSKCKIFYNGNNTDDRGWRTIEPYAIGIHKTSGNTLLRARQLTRRASDTPDGNGKDPLTRLPNGWRLFNIKYITEVKPGGGKFLPGKRSEYNPNDDAFSKVIVAVQKTTKRVGDLYTTGEIEK